MPATGASQQRSVLTNKWYNVRLQQKDQSCAAACVRMMGELLNGTDPGEATVRSYISDSYGQGSALGGGGVVSEPGRDMQVYATNPANMVTALKCLRPAIASAYIFNANTNDALKTKIAEVSTKNPMIIGVFWSTGGGHVMVGVDRDPTTNRVIVADPHYGVKFIEPDGRYEPDTNSKGNVTLAVYKA